MLICLFFVMSGVLRGFFLKSMSNLLCYLLIELRKLTCIVWCKGLMMVLSGKEWRSIAVAMEKMLQCFDALLEEMVKSILLLMMEMLEIFLIFKGSSPDFINEVVEPRPLPLNFLVV